ncbi:MAG: beta-propeller domain-containing protein, partial [Candidatus Daviesbacteria bacterium]|nr:beta-propeller domain-containing protein [Candidatus Daviesbacteria bacterium]
MNSKNKIFSTVLIVLLALSVLVGCEVVPTPPVKTSNIAKFSSGDELLKAFEDARQSGSGLGYRGFGLMKGVAVMEEAAVEAPQAADTTTSGKDFSETNVQVKGVDEPDIIKTDGNYIYTISQGNLVIAKAYPAEDAEILSTTKLDNFSPNELFIDKDRL